MKIEDKSIKLHLIKRLEDYNANMDLGNLEYSRIELEKNKFYLFVTLTLIGLFFTFIKKENLLFLSLLFLLIFEIIQIFFSDKHIRVANEIIVNYQKRRVSGEYIDRLLKEIDDDWNLNWNRLYPIITDSMFKEEEKKVKENISLYGNKIENNPSIKDICGSLKDIYSHKKIVQIKGYIVWKGWQFIKEIKPQGLLGSLKKNTYVFTRINTIYDKSSYIDVYDFLNVKSFKYPKHVWLSAYKEGVYNIKAEIVKQEGIYYLHVLEKEFLKNKGENN